MEQDSVVKYLQNENKRLLGKYLRIPSSNVESAILFFLRLVMFKLLPEGDFDSKVSDEEELDPGMDSARWYFRIVIPGLKLDSVTFMQNCLQ